ncbi:MAG: sulfatase-like hydrolase/transferase [Phycisphaerales bacterium]|nr:sulfatase-like hydrolase/transferase [Phycisphaerales bacterium]
MSKRLQRQDRAARDRRAAGAGGSAGAPSGGGGGDDAHRAAGAGALSKGASRKRLFVRAGGALVAAALLVTAGFVFLGKRPVPREQLNVLLISLDTMRADHLGCYGHPLARTPNIDALAAGGTLFAQCVTSAPTTFPAHASLLTGTYPFVHGARVNAQFELAAENVTLAELLKGAGFVTGAEVSAMVLNREYGLRQGFDTYVDPREVRYRKANPTDQPVNERVAQDVCDGAIQFLRGHASERFFLFVHLYDAHLPYQAPQPFKSQYKDGYLGEIAYVDQQLGRLFRELDALKLTGRTLVVLTGDHGEGRGEHGEEEHGLLVYDATLAVPLILRLPGWIPQGLRIAHQVRHIDVPSTVLDLVQVSGPPAMQGESLMPLLQGERGRTSRAAYSETLSPLFDYVYAPLRSLREEGWKYVLGPKPELYHVAADPKESRNLIDAEPQRAQRMRAELAQLIAAAPRVTDPAAARRAVTAEERSSLQALGYLGSAGEDEIGSAAASNDLERFPPTGPNPVDHAEEVQTLSACMAMVTAGRFEEASARLRPLLASQPAASRGQFNANRLLANALNGLGRLDEAVEHYRKALAERPTDFITLTDLGGALMRLGKLDDAVAVYELALKSSGEMPFVHMQLAAALTAKGDYPAAIAHCEAALKTDPKLANAYAALANIYAKSDRKAEAVEAIRKALAINPASAAFRRMLQDLTGDAP